MSQVLTRADARRLVVAQTLNGLGQADAVYRALEEEFEKRRTDWSRHARPNQVLPEGDWVYWLILAGRGFGKTRTGAEAMREWNRQGHKHCNLIGATVDDARDIMIEGESGILACCPKWDRPYYKKSERKLLWPNGAVSLVFTADEPERLRGKQHAKLWADELAAWRYPESWDQAMFGLRLGFRPQAVVTTTPRPTKIVKELAADEGTILTEGTTYDNQENLAATFFKKIVSKYEGTRLGRQELHAKILDDNPNALWQRSKIDETRVKQSQVPTLHRIVIGVDPAVSSNVNSDETGIVACGLGSDDHLYVLADRSEIYTAAEWGRQVILLHYALGAERIVGEVNNGGDLVESNVRNAKTDEHDGKNVLFEAVRASRGKARRAEPVAALWEQGRAHIVGAQEKLEDQMCEYDPTIPDEKQDSPDRMDAMVWSATDLMGQSTTGMIDFYGSAAKRVEEAKTMHKEKQRG